MTDPLLNDAFEEILSKNEAAKASRAKLDAAQQKHQRAVSNVASSIDTYNDQRAKLICQALLAEGLGICKRHFQAHLIGLHELSGVVLSGTRRGGDHYYEYEEPYVETLVLCSEHRNALSLRRGQEIQVMVDVASYVRELIVEGCRRYGSEEDVVTAFAEVRQIPPRIHELGGLPRGKYAWGEQELDLVR